MAPQVLATSVAGAIAGTEMCLTTVPFDLGEDASGPLSFVESPPPSHAGITAEYGLVSAAAGAATSAGDGLSTEVPGIRVFGVPAGCTFKRVTANFRKQSCDVAVSADAFSVSSAAAANFVEASGFGIIPAAVGYPVSYKLTFLCEGSTPGVEP